MKKKIPILILVLAIVVVIAFNAIACTKTPETQKKDNTGKSKVDITILPDMVDYGANQYWRVNAINYNSTQRSAWETKLQDKRRDELENWMDEENVQGWLDADTKAYISFGTKAIAYGKSEAEWQSNIGYFNVQGKWVTDESANTVERIFCYAEPKAVLDRLAKAAIDADITDAIVEYISRDDAKNRPKGAGYIYTLGQGSAIEDYNQLEELENIYEDFSAYEKDSDYAEPKFSDEDAVYDAMMLKERKIYAEIFNIFNDNADQFARTAIAMCGYAIEVISTDMIPAYEERLGGSISDSKIINYMRTEMYDYETLSYLLAFREYVSLSDDSYEALMSDNTMGAAMSLYGYHYQYKHRDYLTFDDNQKVTYKGKEITEYEHFLKLSHFDYFNDESEALTYRNYDRRQYEKSYRYSYACYEKYYNKQLNFQSLQEKYDREIYVGGRFDRFNSGIGYWQPSSKKDKTYTEEMEDALKTGFEATLKISDVNWEYTGVDRNVTAYNYASKAWNSLSSVAQKNNSNKILKVNLECEQLKSQNYTLTHKSITNNDLINALKYQIRSYSSDSIRGIQSCKKDEVIYVKDLDRFMEANSLAENDTLTGFQRTAYDDISEDIGRNYVKYSNLLQNYTYDSVEKQMTAAEQANWSDKDGVRYNVATTLAVKYDEYAKQNHNISVDEYFQDTLIHKIYSCGGTLEDCLAADGSHMNCTKEYDTNWALSRLLDNHEVVLRYMYGQIEVTFYQIKADDIKSDTVFANGPSDSTSADAVTGKWYNITGNAYATVGTENVDTDKAMGTVCRLNYKKEEEPSQYLPGTSGVTMGWNKVPKYAGVRDLTVTDGSTGVIVSVSKNNATYKYTFIGWYVDESFLYPVILDEEINYDIRLYPCYRMTKESK